MTVIDNDCLNFFRQAGPCELCGQRFLRRDPHHVLCRGLGGGHRLDIPLNLVSVGPAIPYPLCSCHGDIHAGRIKRDAVLAVVAKREGFVGDLEEKLWRIQRAPKGSDWRTV